MTSTLPSTLPTNSLNSQVLWNTTAELCSQSQQTSCDLLCMSVPLFSWERGGGMLLGFCVLVLWVVWVLNSLNRIVLNSHVPYGFSEKQIVIMIKSVRL